MDLLPLLASLLLLGYVLVVGLLARELRHLRHNMFQLEYWILSLDPPQAVTPQLQSSPQNIQRDTVSGMSTTPVERIVLGYPRYRVSRLKGAKRTLIRRKTVLTLHDLIRNRLRRLPSRFQKTKPTQPMKHDKQKC